MTIDMWHVTCDTWYVTCRGGGGGVNIFSKFGSLADVCDLWNYEDLEEKAHSFTDWMNYLMNHEAFYRAAQATPSLFTRRCKVNW